MSSTPLDPPDPLEPDGTTYQPPAVAASETVTVQTLPPQAPVGRLNAGRIATYVGAVAGLCTALAPVIANLDITSTVGLVGGMGAVAGVLVTWLRGWQKYEADVRDPTKLNEPAP